MLRYNSCDSVFFVHQFYSFTDFALMLNDFPDELKAKVAPTDCRWRPDMRKMEEGDIGKILMFLLAGFSSHVGWSIYSYALYFLTFNRQNA